MSADLVWQIIRQNSCFLRRQRGIQKHFSVEKFNLSGKNSKRFNGLINKRAIDVSAAPDNKGVVLSVKVKGKAAQPAKGVKSVTLTKKHQKTVKHVARQYGLGAYAKLAQRRAAAIVRSQQPKSKKFARKTA